MPDYGLLPTGFARKRYDVILGEILADLKTATGKDFDADPESVTGQFIKIFAEREAQLWEILQAEYNAMYPSSAVGQALDNAASFVGVRRLPAQRSNVPAILYGTEGTIVNADSIARSAQSSGNYLLDEAVTISLGNAVDVNLAVTPVNSFYYSILINGLSVNYASDSSATLAEVKAGLIASFTALGFHAIASTDGVRVNDVNLKPFSIIFGGGFTANLIGSPGIFYRQTVGSEVPPVGTLTNIVTTVSGWNSVNNPINASPGRLSETDTELRARYNIGVFRTGAGAAESIQANLFEDVPGITYAIVYENKGDIVDADGRPPHSVEAVVMGGLNEDIYKLLLKQVAAGIQTFGNTSGTIYDSQLVPQLMAFSRPVPVLGWIKLTINSYAEEILPDNAPTLIASTVVETGNNFGVGKDIIPQRFLGPIYDKLKGIGQITVTVATGATTPPSGSYTSNVIPVNLRSVSQWDASRVSVVIT